MRWSGVVYDVGRAMGPRSADWRPDYTPGLVRRELEIIRGDLHATAVRLCARDPQRLAFAGAYALDLGLEVWVCPELWNATPARTLAYLDAAAPVAEDLHWRAPGRVTLSVGNELTFFMRGIVPGRTHHRRVHNRQLRTITRERRHTPPLRAFLAEAVAVVRRSYDGPLTYCALPFEDPDWTPFDVAGVNLYRNPATERGYGTVLDRLAATGRPVVVTELGYAACRDADNPEFLGTFNAKPWSFALSRLLGAVRPRVRTIHPRDEAAQARMLLDQLSDLDRRGVAGAFVMSFSFPLAPYDEDPRHDLDATALSLVRTLRPGRHGVTYPDLPWEPKQAFHALAAFYRGAA
ncbi:hypothetical protein COUCH_26080 [Couchioplanes caeruleus]|uniref:hypothetical protein n=1 Tax=Couchioplanes caeruleus TaxID=56438 RepID=UPI0020BD9D6D|nr:hypothetical protein [Couchioplanes caeruleus]UQU62490.1 hypothetical protein COUCH_26080 [Couchioplanes caeruleus]